MTDDLGSRTSGFSDTFHQSNFDLDRFHQCDNKYNALVLLWQSTCLFRVEVIFFHDICGWRFLMYQDFLRQYSYPLRSLSPLIHYPMSSGKLHHPLQDRAFVVTSACFNKTRLYLFCQANVALPLVLVCCPLFFVYFPLGLKLSIDVRVTC